MWDITQYLRPNLTQDILRVEVILKCGPMAQCWLMCGQSGINSHQCNFNFFSWPTQIYPVTKCFMSSSNTDHVTVGGQIDPSWWTLWAISVSEWVRCSSMVEHPLMVQWIIGSIPYGGPIELFLVPASAPWLDKQRVWYVLSCLWDDAYKRSLAANRKRVAHVVATVGFQMILYHIPDPECIVK